MGILVEKKVKERGYLQVPGKDGILLKFTVNKYKYFNWSDRAYDRFF